jgi:nucleoside-diphosphate-sugar epimerase
MFELNDEFKKHAGKAFSEYELHLLSQRKFYISGGTGFVGRWIITILRNVIEENNLPKITIISRTPVEASKLFIPYKNLSITDWGSINLESLIKPSKQQVVGFHSSVPASGGQSINRNEFSYFNQIIHKYIEHLGSKYDNPIFVNVSSGTVYRRPHHGLIPEKFAEMKSSNLEPYDIVKLNDESVTTASTKLGIIQGTNPRLFSFTGPGMDLPGKFAIGSFVADALSGRQVRIKGNIGSFRSYMSPLDMGIWLLKSSLYPTLNTLHIGSQYGSKMLEIAYKISQEFGTGEIIVPSGTNSTPEAYVPETSNTSKLLNLDRILDFDVTLNLWKKDLTHSMR